MAGPFSLRTLRQALGYELDDIVVGNVTANGDTDDVIDTTVLPAYDDHLFEDYWFRSNGAGASANQVRKVDSFTASTGTLHLKTALSAALSTVGPDQYELHRRFDPAWKDLAIKKALHDVWPDVHNPTVDRSLTGLADTYTYTLPATIQDKPPEIFIEQENGELLPPAALLTRWKWYRSGATAKIEFSEIPTVGRTIRIRHMAVLTEPASDTATSEVYTREEPIILAAAALNLYRRLYASATGQGREELKEDIGFWEQELRQRIAERGMPPMHPTQHIWTNIQ